jgi:outer membrane protein assembly factor BamA
VPEYYLLPIIIILLSISVRSMAVVSNDSIKRIHYIVIPAIFRSPETGWAFGVATSISFKTSERHDSLTRSSSIQAIGFYTTKGQNVQAIDATIYFPKEHFIYSNQIAHSYFPDKFWGMGPYTKDKNKEPYTFEQFYFFPRLSRKLKKNVFAGLIYEYQNVFKIDYLKGGTFDSSSFYGKTKYSVSGLGFSTTYDSRNVSFWPTKGILIESLLDCFSKMIGSDYNFIKWTLDFRSFTSLAGKTVLCTQFYNYSTFGNTPLRDLAALGGATNMRGIYDGRFRDNNSTSFTVEYRIHIWDRLSICTFGDIGNVYHKAIDLRSPLKYSFGEGLRIALLKKDKLNLRLDYGYYTKKNQGFYLNVGECF